MSIYKSPAGERIVMDLYDSALAHWPVPYETQMIPTRHGETFVIASGDAANPPLVLLHGAAGNSATWGDDVRGYVRRYHSYAVDLPIPIRPWPPRSAAVYRWGCADFPSGRMISAVL